MAQRTQRTRAKKKSAGRTVLIILIALLVICAAVLGGLLLYTKSVVGDSDGKILPNTKIADIDVGGMTKNEAVAAVTDKVNDSSLILKADNKEVRIPIAKTKAEYDADKTAEKAYGIGRDGGFMDNFKKAYASKHDGTKIKMDVSISDDDAKEIVTKNEKRFNCKPKNAKIRPKNGKGVIIDDQVGLKIKVDESTEAVKKTLKSWKGTKAECELSAKKDEPKYTAEDLKGLTDVLGKYSTEFDRGYYGRVKNLENGTAKISDTVLAPDEQLSVYKLTSPYTADNGYYRAGTYVGDETIESYGGGMCQVSTTLYNAAIRAELEIVERECHSRTVHYVPLSADAAISGTEKDLKFKNNLEDPVYIFGYVDADDGHMSFYVFGKETRDPKRTIEFESKVTSVTAPTEKVKKDKTLEEGKRKVEQYGQTGYTAELWKVVYVDGKEKSRKQFNSSSYRMVPTKVIEGTKKKDKDKEKDKKKKKSESAPQGTTTE
ncbi:MAG: VanW family protein [Firmicutes bacterium]|nr:VanW family protein [Bacillota bacterium]